MDRYALDDAAAAALFDLARMKDEHMGALFRDGKGGYGQSNIVVGDGTSVKGQIRIPTGSLAALFHNHPELREESNTPGRLKSSDHFGDRFSEGDKRQAHKLGVPSYITDVNGKVRRYDPATKKTEDVLALFPWEDFKAYIARTYGQGGQ